MRARIRLTVKKLLRKHKYPPDEQACATETVLEQAELLGGELASEVHRPGLPPRARSSTPPQW